MTKKEQYEQVSALLAARRQRAILETQKRRETVQKKIPQIAKMEQTMSQSVIRLSRLILAKAADSSEMIPRIMQENLSAQQQIERLLQENGFPKDYLHTHYYCSHCDDTGFSDGKRCRCFQELLKKIAVEDFNRSTAVRLATFRDFRLDYYNAQNRNPGGLSDREIMSRIYHYCVNYAREFKKTSSGILMIGNTGLGKTHLSLSIANEVIQQGYTVLYGSAQEFFSNIQNEFFGKNRGGEDTTLTIQQADLFILDDLGAEYESSFNVSTFYNLINFRLSHQKSTIINTNLTPQEIETRYGKRVASRLITLYQCLKFVGTDIRQLKLGSL